jgi:hypothetical protein
MAWLESFFTPEQAGGRIDKRAPYRPHKDNIQALEPFFRAMASREKSHGALALIAKTGNIPAQTVDTWNKILRVSTEWRPSRERYREVHRIFTDPEERELMARINHTYLTETLFCCDTVCQKEALKLAADIVARIETRSPAPAAVGERCRGLLMFKAPRHFVSDFRTRHAISLRCPALKRRPAVDPAAVGAFIKKMSEILMDYPADRVINIDETQWKLVNGSVKAWGPRGAESVRVTVDDDAKDGVIAIGAVDAAGGKLPLTVVGKGKTLRCLKRDEPPPEVGKLQSNSGWTTSDVICQYLQDLRDNHSPDGPLVMVPTHIQRIGQRA